MSRIDVKYWQITGVLVLTTLALYAPPFIQFAAASGCSGDGGHCGG